jgi:hypothetical protein
VGDGGQRPLVSLLLLRPQFLPIILLGMTGISLHMQVAWQCLSKRTIVYLLRIKLHAHM